MCCLRFVVFAVLFCLFILTYGQTGLNSKQRGFIKEREKVVKGLALHATELHSRRVQFVRECECSKHGCSNDFLDVPCETRYGTQPFCERKGWRLGLGETIFRTAPGADPKDLSDTLKENICVYRHIYDYVARFRKSNFNWMYVATLDGHFRRHPASARERGEEDGDRLLGYCRQYDPRIRPWFIAASTGPKDIVLVLDKSESMNEIVGRNKTKWDLTLQAAERMLGTFSFADFVNLVTFSDEAKPLNKKGLLRANSENLEKFREEIREVTPKGKTNFTAAFTTAFDQLSNYCEEEPKTCSNCHKIILFLTDGRDTSGYLGDGVKPSKMAEIIEELQDELVNKTGKRASIFTYSMSEQADDAIPRQIACSNHGAWAFLGTNVDPLDALNSYYLFIAAGRKNVKPIWVDPYEDAAGAGLVTTVAMPFFAKGTSRVEDVFLGVAGHDVILSELEIDSTTDDQVINTIIDRSERCTPSDSTQCELQAYRNSRDPRGVCTDPFPVEKRSRRGSKAKDDVQCYSYIDRFYKRFPKEASWEQAVSLCKKDGGSLISIEDEKELAFVANLADIDGSWVGARKEKFEYIWLDEDTGFIPEESVFWGVGEPIYRYGTEDCVAIDTRGIVNNLMAKPCTQRLSYICRYDSKKHCKSGVADIPKEGFFEVPPLAACDYVVEVLDETKPIAEVSKLTSKDVMCPLGHRKRTTDEVICCSKGSKKD